MRLVLRGWCHGLRAIAAQRGTRSSAERREAAWRLVRLREAVREQLRLLRL